MYWQKTVTKHSRDLLRIAQTTFIYEARLKVSANSSDGAAGENRFVDQKSENIHDGCSTNIPFYTVSTNNWSHVHYTVHHTKSAF